MKTKSLPLLLTLTQTHPSQADVNVYEASFSKDFSDTLSRRDRRQTITLNPQTVALKRVYKSRSLHQGAFGFGWCTQLEKKLDVRNNKSLTLYDCEAPHPITFIQRSQTRGGFALFTSPTRPNEFIWQRGHVYEHYQNNQLIQKYNAQGLLATWRSPDNRLWHFVYDAQERVKEIRLPDQTLSLQWNADGQVTKLQSPVATFDYSYADGNLVQVLRDGHQEYIYHYDHLHNLTEIRRADGSKENIIYDTNKDWVLQYKRALCIESYQYQTSIADPQTFEAKKSKSCAGQPVMKTHYTFQHLKGADQRSYLARISIETNGHKNLLELNPITGQVLRVAAGKESRVMAYERKIKGALNEQKNAELLQNFDTTHTDRDDTTRTGRK